MLGWQACATLSDFISFLKRSHNYDRASIFFLFIDLWAGSFLSHLPQLSVRWRAQILKSDHQLTESSEQSPHLWALPLRDGEGACAYCTRLWWEQNANCECEVLGTEHKQVLRAAVTTMMWMEAVFGFSQEKRVRQQWAYCLRDVHRKERWIGIWW